VKRLFFDRTLRSALKFCRKVVKLNMEKTALLVIDMINDFIRVKECPLYCHSGEQTLGKVIELIELSHSHQMQVIVAKDEHRKNDGDFAVRPIHAVKGTWGAELVEPLKTKLNEEDYIINKRRHSAFSYTDLDLFLREEKIENIILGGGWTNTGVRSTASDAFYQGYKVTIISDCCFSQTEEMQQSGLRDIGMFGQVVTMEEFKDQFTNV
jgi:nicotinamidase-related amidase